MSQVLIVYVTSDADYAIRMPETEFQTYKDKHPEARIIGTYGVSRDGFIESSTRLPEVLYLDPEEGLYRYGTRQRTSERMDVLVRSIGKPTSKSVWVCLDTSNGNPELPSGRVYVWVFKTRAAAKAQLALHARNPKTYARLQGCYLYTLFHAHE